MAMTSPLRVRRTALEEVTANLKEVWLIKVRATLGPEATDDKEVSILNRIIRWTEDSLLYEADPRHVEKLLRDAGLEDCNALGTPGVKQPTDADKSWFEGESAPHGEVDGDANRLVSIGVAPESTDIAADGSQYLDRDRMRDYRSAVARCNYLAADRLGIAFTTNPL